MRIIKKMILLFLIIIIFSCTSYNSSLEQSYIKLSKQVLPSVVEIISVGIDNENNSKWLDFFQDQEDLKNEDLNTGVGSGVIAHKSDKFYYIITNRHVVGNLDKVSILLHDNELLIGEVIGLDDRFDLAVIKIESEKELKVAKLSKNNNLKVGQFVAAIGSPMSYVQSVSMGIISNLNRFGGPKENISNFIQTDAAINHGNSGGPLVNMKGEVIGINTWISSPTSGSIGLGFAMPINNIYPSFISIIENGTIRIGWLGVSSYGSPNTEYFKNKNGAFVNHVVIDSPAYLGGIRPGDIIKKINDHEIKTPQELYLNISLLSPDDIALLEINRYSNDLILEIKLNENVKDTLETSKNIFPGFILNEKNKEISIIQILPKSTGLVSGFLKDDVILSVNENLINTIEEFYFRIELGKNKVVILRNNDEIELELNY